MQNTEVSEVFVGAQTQYVSAIATLSKNTPIQGYN